MEINSTLPKGTVGVPESRLPESSQYFNKTVTGKIYFKLRKVGIEGLYADAFSRIYTTPSVKRWIQKVEDKSDSEGRATIFTGCLKLNLK
jgi:hypothetical protein